MSAQNFLSNLTDGVQRVIAGDDYLDLDKSDRRTTKQRTGEWRQDRTRRMEAHRVGQKTPAGTTMGGTGYSPIQKTPKAPSSGTVNSSPISSPISPKPTAPTPPKPTGGGAAAPGMTVKGGLASALVGTAANYAVPWIVEESTRGARMLLGDKNYNTPVNIKSVNGTNYDISTSGGMEAYKKAKASAGTSTPAYSGSRKGAMMGVPNDPSYKTEELEQGQKAEDFRKGAGFTGQSPTRDVQKATGLGTQTSPGGGMPILDAAGAQAFYQSVGLGGFMSNQLPGTTSSPDNRGTIEAVPFGGQETSVTENTLGVFNGVNGNAMANLNPKIGAEAFTNPEVIKAIGSTLDQYGGLAQSNGAPTVATQGTKSYKEIRPTDPIAEQAFGEDWVKSNGGGSTRLNEALNDTAGINAYMSKFGSPEEDRMRAANMAFLNYVGKGGSVMGLRAKEAILGGIQAGGQYYQLNEGRDALISGEDGKPIAADPDKTRAFKSGNLSATGFRNSFKDQVNAIASDAETPIATPKAGENPFAQMPAPATTAFLTNTPAGILAPGTTEVGEMIDTVQAMDMTPSISNKQIRNSFLNQREPLMRDPRKSRY